MIKKALLLFAVACMFACSKDKQDALPGDDLVSCRIGANAYSFTSVPDPSENYYDEGNGMLQFTLTAADGASLKISAMYLSDLSFPFGAVGSTGPPPPPSAAIVFTEAGGSQYILRTVLEEPWFLLLVESKEGNVWTGTFSGYIQNASNQRVNITNGSFKVSLTNR